MNRTDAKKEIRERWREIIPNYTEQAARRSQGEITYICPFCGHGTHGDGLKSNPRSSDGNGLKCFGCNFSGDIIDFIMQKTGRDYLGALSEAAGILGITIDQERQQDSLERPQRTKSAANDKKPDGTQKAAQKPPQEPKEAPRKDFSEYYKVCQNHLNEGLPYLEARGISEKAAEVAGIGYDPKTKFIIIPCTKYFYVARNTDTKSDFRYNNPKGVNADFFNPAAFTEKTQRPLFVTEGAFDALSILQEGGDAAALNSTSNAERLLRDIEELKVTRPIILLLDNDEKGREATAKLQRGLEAAGIPYTIERAPGNVKDPNEALITDREQFREFLREAAGRADPLGAFISKIQTETYKPHSTGLKFFDDLLGGGIVSQSLLLLLAAPGTGKTTLAQQIAESLAAKRQPVIYLNFEMSREQMLAKAISARLGRQGKAITTAEILQGYKWSEDKKELILKEIEKYRAGAAPWIRYNPGGISNRIEHLESYLKQEADAAREAGRPAPAVVVDYLHLLTAEKEADAKEIIKNAVVMMKNYAKDNDTFVICIVATNRDSNKAGRVTMESGRDSSNIEYTGDYQLSLNYYDLDKATSALSAEELAEIQAEPCRRMIIRVLKNRFGELGRSCNVYFYARLNTFYGENEFIPTEPERTPFDTGRTQAGGNGRPITKVI